MRAENIKYNLHQHSWEPVRFVCKGAPDRYFIVKLSFRLTAHSSDHLYSSVSPFLKQTVLQTTVHVGSGR